MNEDVTVHVVDDDDSVRKAISRLLASAGFQTRTYASAEELLATAVGRDAVDVVLTDLRMERMDGLTLARALKAAPVPPAVVFLSGRGHLVDGVRAMKEGAIDFLEKPVRDQELVDAIRRAVAGIRAARQKRLEMSELQRRYDTVTAREREVFVLVASGLLNKEAAWELGISEKTVKVHRGRLVQKMGAQSLADLVRMAGKLRIPVRTRADLQAAASGN